MGARPFDVSLQGEATFRADRLSVNRSSDEPAWLCAKMMWLVGRAVFGTSHAWRSSADTLGVWPLEVVVSVAERFRISYFLRVFRAWRLKMSRFIMTIALGVIVAGEALAQGTVYQPGYMRRDGTYVDPHYRSTPDGNRFNNWSSQGNINPYTGRQGTIDPYRQPPSSYGFGSPSRSYDPYRSRR